MVTPSQCPLYSRYPELEERLPRLTLSQGFSPVRRLSPLEEHLGRPDGGASDGAPRIPTGYLESLFGADVHRALDMLKAELEKKRRGEGSELMDTLIIYEWKEALGPYPRDPAEIV